MLRSYKVVIDGNTVGDIRRGETKRLDVDPAGARSASRSTRQRAETSSSTSPPAMWRWRGRSPETGGRRRPGRPPGADRGVQAPEGRAPRLEDAPATRLTRAGVGYPLSAISRGAR